LDARGGSEAGFADAAFAAEQQDAHVTMIASAAWHAGVRGWGLGAKGCVFQNDQSPSD
jgi:hypothetical protein